jgi:carbon-monoxide dehydrogenase medium subunit
LAHADPAAELPAVALAVGAEMIVQSPAGQRTMGAGDFFEGYLSSALGEDELLVGVRFPATAAASS